PVAPVAPPAVAPPAVAPAPVAPPAVAPGVTAPVAPGVTAPVAPGATAPVAPGATAPVAPAATLVFEGPGATVPPPVVPPGSTVGLTSVPVPAPGVPFSVFPHAAPRKTSPIVGIDIRILFIARSFAPYGRLARSRSQIEP